MKKVAVLLVTFFLVACSDQEEPKTEAVTLDADTYMKLDLIYKLSEIAKKNEEIFDEETTEAMRNYLRGLEDRDRTDTTTEEKSSEADSQ